jgi:putative nucleotidyltransferase with HDIG domain
MGKNMQNNPQFIEVNQLQVGLYIHLDLGWMDHPFTVSNFKIKNKEQIDKIKLIGLSHLRYDPLRSDCAPLPLKNKLSSSQEALSATAEIKQQAALNKEPLKDRLALLQHSLNECENKFLATSHLVKTINKNIITAPKLSLTQAQSVVNDLCETALMEGDIVVHAMQGNRSSDAHFEHSLNVTVLSLMLSKSVDISHEDVRVLGLSALLHDIGKAEVSDKILMKKEPLTDQEKLHYQEHIQFGQQMIKDAGLPMRVGRIIGEHHEYADGSGYPLGLTLDRTDRLSSLLTICNKFDNLCNPANPNNAKTPYEALSHMYAHQRSKFDEELLKRFIKSLGVYPPGCNVKLSNGLYGTVISVNPNYPLKPFVKIFHQQAHSQAQANGDELIIDLRDDPSVSITACLRPNALPDNIARQLFQRKKNAYFIDNIKPDTMH